MVAAKQQACKELSTTLNQDVIRRDLEKMNRSVKNREEKLKRDQLEIRMKNQKRQESHGAVKKDLARSQRE